MKILITQRALERFGGSELFTAELARSLATRGHKVAVYCPRPGRLAKLITPSGIPVKDKLDDLPWRPDVIHGQHHLPAMAALAKFSGVPMVYCWHGARPWVEQVPRHDRIRAYVVTSQRLAPRLASERDIPIERVVVIPNFVDCERFSFVRKVSSRPTRAVLYGQGGFYPEELKTLEDACDANGLSLAKVGYAFNNPRPRPEYFLPDFDVAFAVGRSALEAMAAGCAVIPIVPQLAGHRITKRNLKDWVEANFSPRYFTSSDRFDREWLASELRTWSQEDIASVTDQVRREFDLPRAIDAFLRTYADAVAQESSADCGLDRYLEGLAVDADAMWHQSNEDSAELERLRKENARLHQEAAANERRVRELLELLLRKSGMTEGLSEDPSPENLRETIRKSGLFDPDWYVLTYPDVGQTRMDPLDHYLRYGAFEGREPAPGIDSKAYMAANPHLKGLGMSVLEHQVRQLSLLIGGIDQQR